MGIILGQEVKADIAYRTGSIPVNSMITLIGDPAFTAGRRADGKISSDLKPTGRGVIDRRIL